MSPTEPDPTALELARVVAWLRTRAKRRRANAKTLRAQKQYQSALLFEYAAETALADAADLERGEQP